MRRTHKLKVKQGSGCGSEPEALWLRGRRARGVSVKHVMAQVLLWVPIVACLAASARMGWREEATGETIPKERIAPGGTRVVAVMRSAPLAAEEEGGMPSELLQLVEDPVQAREQTERIAFLYRRWTLRSPFAAGESALASCGRVGSPRPLAAVLEEWLAQEPEAAMTWVVSCRGVPFKAEILGGVFDAAMASQPVETRALWAGRFTNEPTDVAKVATEWVRREPAAAVEWLRRMRPGDGKAAGLKALVAAWMEEDPARAGAFVAGMEPGRLRELAVATVAAISPGGVAVDPERAVEVDVEGDDWLVRQGGRGEGPRTVKRRPAGDSEP